MSGGQGVNVRSALCPSPSRSTGLDAGISPRAGQLKDLEGATHSRLLLDEGVGEGLVDGDPFARVQHEHLLHHLLELGHLAHLVVGQALIADQVGQQVLARADRTHHGYLLL